MDNNIVYLRTLFAIHLVLIKKSSLTTGLMAAAIVLLVFVVFSCGKSVSFKTVLYGRLSFPFGANPSKLSTRTNNLEIKFPIKNRVYHLHTFKNIEN